MSKTHTSPSSPGPLALGIALLTLSGEALAERNGVWNGYCNALLSCEYGSTTLKDWAFGPNLTACQADVASKEGDLISDGIGSCTLELERPCSCRSPVSSLPRDAELAPFSTSGSGPPRAGGGVAVQSADALVLSNGESFNFDGAQLRDELRGKLTDAEGFTVGELVVIADGVVENLYQVDLRIWEDGTWFSVQTELDLLDQDAILVLDSGFRDYTLEATGVADLIVEGFTPPLFTPGRGVFPRSGR